MLDIYTVLAFVDTMAGSLEDSNGDAAMLEPFVDRWEVTQGPAKARESWLAVDADGQCHCTWALRLGLRCKVLEEALEADLVARHLDEA